MISRHQIDEVIARTDLLSLIGSRVTLKPAGTQRMKGCCPFHNEKTPSFVVYLDQRNYHCFGCGANGNAIDWVMHHDGLRYQDAVRQLAHEVGVTITTDKKEEKQQPIDPALQLLEQTSLWFAENLVHHPQAPTVRDYIAKRGVAPDIQQRFRLGYAPPGWDNLAKKLKNNSEAYALAKTLGLLKHSNKEQDHYRQDGSEQHQQTSYDAFRDRLIFPIFDRGGRIVGFGGRSLHKDQIPKYLNSSESAVFAKGRLLYGEYQAKQVGRVHTWLVVEGYMDVIAMHQHGLHNTVACLGTSINPEQITSLVRQCNEVCFIFDGDTAGRKAAIRAMQLCSPLIQAQRNFRFLLLPEGEDPDSLLATKGATAMHELLHNSSQPWSDFFLHWLSTQANSYSVEGKTKLIALAEEQLNAVPNRDFRTLMMRKIKNQLGLGFGQYGRNKRNSPPPIKAQSVNREKRREIGLLKLLAASMRSPDVWMGLQESLLPQLQNFSPPLSSKLIKCLDLVKDEKNLLVHLASELDEQQRNALEQFSKALTSPLSEELLESQVRSVLSDCWQIAEPNQRQQLVHFLGERRALRTQKTMQSGGVF